MQSVQRQQKVKGKVQRKWILRLPTPGVEVHVNHVTPNRVIRRDKEIENERGANYTETNLTTLGPFFVCGRVYCYEAF